MAFNNLSKSMSIILQMYSDIERLILFSVNDLLPTCHTIFISKEKYSFTSITEANENGVYKYGSFFT